MSAHPHAELMALYAEDARETAEPWLRWQHRLKHANQGWEDCAAHHSMWDTAFDYRRKPTPPRQCVVGKEWVFASGRREISAWPMDTACEGTPMIELTPEVRAALAAAGIEVQS
ncbi:MAG: hypothetical protein M3Q51_04485 [Pseudomonadota bacterium]|nr:hypothetical protein [Pseudomonadota bacterium]